MGFRLPTRQARKQMSIAELQQTLDAYTEWFFAHEEDMGFAEADDAWNKKEKLAEYIRKRQKKVE